MKKAERRQQLLGVAIDILAADGLPGLRLERLAEKGGVTLARVCQYFPDDAALSKLAFAAVLDLAFPPVGVKADDPLAQLQGVLEHHFATARKPNAALRALMRCLATERSFGHDALVETGFGCHAELVAIIIAGQQAGVFRRSLDADHTADELIRLLAGYALLGMTPGDKPSAGDRTPAIEFLLHGLLKTDV